MNCGDLRDHYELHALGLADEPERSEIDAHLERGCEVCMKEMKLAREMAALLASSAAPMAPSPKLRRRILASVGVNRIGWAPFFAGATAFSLAAAMYFGGREADFSRQVQRLTEEARLQNIQLTHLNEVFAILNSPGATVVSFGENKPVPKGKVICNPQMGLVLIASNLPPAPAGKAYELWLIPKAKGGTPERGGMFQSESNGAAMYLQRGPVDMNRTAGVAVTMEAAAGVDQPTTQPVVYAAFPALQ